jgi:hypothetical protein
MRKDGIEYSERDMGTSVEKRDWVSVGTVAFHFIEGERQDGHAPRGQPERRCAGSSAAASGTT